MRMPCAVTSQLNEHDRLMQAQDDAAERRVNIECELLADQDKWKKFVRDTIEAIGMSHDELLDAYAESVALRYASESQAAVRAWGADAEWSSWCDDDSAAMETPIKQYVDDTIKSQDEASQPDRGDDY